MNYKKTFDMILCMDLDNGIAQNNKIPWYNSIDINFFKKITSETIDKFKTNIILMGLNTFKTIDNILPNRVNVVLTKQKLNNIRTITNIDDIFNLYDDNIENIFIIGGKQLYESLINHVNLRYIYVSKLKQSYNCDLFMSDNFISYINQNEKTILFNNDTIEISKYNCRSNPEYQYLDIIYKLLFLSNKKLCRNGYVYSSLYESLQFNIQDGFPLLTTKHVFMKGVFYELKMFLLGFTNTDYLRKHNVHIWDGNTNSSFINNNNLNLPEWCLGPMYGHNFRHFGLNYDINNIDNMQGGYDQLKYIIDTINNNPTSRRIIMTSYNPSVANEGVLYPCHGLLIQFYCDDNNLSLIMTQRSMDIICGCPFNIASYALFLIIVAKITNKTPYKIIINANDVHLYDEETHINASITSLSRKPFPFCKLNINKSLSSIDDIQTLEFSDIIITNYNKHNKLIVNMVP